MSDLSALAEETDKANRDRTPREWRGRISAAVDDIRRIVKEAKAEADADLGVDMPVTPLSAKLTGSFIAIAKIEHALVWLDHIEARSLKDRSE